MPGGDGTGPNGMGPMTGWGRGVCGRPHGMRRGYGGVFPGGARGRRNRFGAFGEVGWDRGGWTEPLRRGHASERRWLEERSTALEAEQREIRARLETLAKNED